MNSIVQKPWGYYEILKSGKKFLVKKLFIKPGGMLSLQNHEHRSEHWLVAEGEVEVTLDKKTINLVENENIFIPKGALHRIANKGSKDLIIIEMWYGEILDEYDIIRYDKNYNINVKTNVKKMSWGPAGGQLGVGKMSTKMSPDIFGTSF